MYKYVNLLKTLSKHLDLKHHTSYTSYFKINHYIYMFNISMYGSWVKCNQLITILWEKVKESNIYKLQKLS